MTEDPTTDRPHDDQVPEQPQADADPVDGAVPEEPEATPTASATEQATPSEDDGVAAEGSPEDAEDQPDPLAVAEAQRDDYLDQLQRSRADYDNLNKRRHREVAEARDRGQAALVEDLLEVLDNFGFALKAAEVSEDTQLAKGVQLVYDQLVDVLRRAGLEEVPGVGAPFDPAHHEALVSEADGAEREHPEVTEVLRTGYRFKQHLLRPAAVKVAE